MRTKKFTITPNNISQKLQVIEIAAPEYFKGMYQERPIEFAGEIEVLKDYFPQLYSRFGEVEGPPIQVPAELQIHAVFLDSGRTGPQEEAMVPLCEVTQIEQAV